MLSSQVGQTACDAARRAAPHSGRICVHVPTASETHFFSKLLFAAPASFFSFAETSQALAASVSHFFMKLVRAAPASFFSVLCALHVAVSAWPGVASDRLKPMVRARRARVMVSLRSVLIDGSSFSLPACGRQPWNPPSPMKGQRLDAAL